jgi:hypothetical protein
MENIRTEITHGNRTFLVRAYPDGYGKVEIKLNLVIRPHRKWLGRYESLGSQMIFEPRAFRYSIPTMIQKALESYTKELDHEEKISKMWEKGLDN